jgi:tripartite-type tricarboxylate transporter receptor subunit TctC
MNRGIKRALAAGLVAMAAQGAYAAYPERPIRILVPFAPGGNVDLTARALLPGMTDALGRGIVVDNRGGAGGAIAAELVAKAVPDGYTLLVGSSGILSIAPGMNDKLPYHPIRSYEQIALISNVALVLVVRNENPVKTVKDLIALSKSKAEPLTMGSSGNFSTGQLAGVLFQNRTGTHFTHVPFKGASLAAIDLMGGHVDLMFDQITSSIGNIRSGRLRALAVTSVTRSPDLPDVPTMKEAGAPGVEAGTFTAMLAPLHTPRDIVDKLNQVVNNVLKESATKAAFAKLGADTLAGTPAETRTYMQRELDKWSAVLHTIKDLPPS